MARKRYSDEDVLNLLRQIELSLASGSSIETVKPPFYVPFPDRVSGTGDRMFRA